MELTIKIQINTDSNGNIVIGDINQTVNTAAIVEGDFFLSESHKKYNYVAIGKSSPIQLPKNQNIKVIFDDVIALTHTHSSQINRIDKLKKILDHFDIGEQIHVSWNANEKIVTFKKSKK
ncbi:MAG: hypothetical protein K1W16_13335 [Lachnospiraceae bacterium]|jgi:hypothetical protein